MSTPVEEALAVADDEQQQRGVVNGNSSSSDHPTKVGGGVSEEKKESTLSMEAPTVNGVVKDKHMPDDMEEREQPMLPATPSNINDPGSSHATPTVTPDGLKALRVDEQIHVSETDGPEKANVGESTGAYPMSQAGEEETPSPPHDALEEKATSAKKVDLTLETTTSEASEIGETSPTVKDEYVEATEKKEPSLSDDDSSNDDSSYFADPSNLPSPKSGRQQFSHSGIASGTGGGSATQMTMGANREAYNRESDASLSLSDDSDDAVHNARRTGQQPRAGVPELYPHPLTRMHSVSSLVSTSSHNSSETDRSVQDELRDVAGRRPSRHRPGGTPSGRRSPVLGEHPPSRVEPFFQSPMSVNPQPSPPTILSARQQRPTLHFAHPQPHLMTAEELDSWVSAGNIPPVPFPTVPAFRGPMDTKESPPSKEGNSFYTYSEESEQLQSHSGFQASGGGEPRPVSSSASRKGRRDVQEGPEEGMVDRRGEFSRSKDAANTGVQARLVDTGRDDKRGGVGDDGAERGFKVYWQRWVMLFYMSILNLLSDWTCYSVAPIAILTEEAFGNINAEQLVVVFLGANAVATACEPIILSRLGLKRTVLFGALLLMIGSIIKSGGMPPIIEANLQKGHGEWRVYLGFFLVGLSQPLYQCTPALLSASWFPERERTMATGVALNANQVGIGFAFIFGTLLVSNSDDIPGYFGLLSIIATLTFLGVLIQFDDAPPTPPSDTARVMRGTMEVGLPSMRTLFESVRNLGGAPNPGSSGAGVVSDKSRSRQSLASSVDSASRDIGRTKGSKQSSARRDHANRRSSRSSRRSSQGSSTAVSSSRRGSGGGARRRTASRPQPTESGGDGEGFHALAPSPSPVRFGRVGVAGIAPGEVVAAPSPMLPGTVGRSKSHEDEGSESAQAEDSASNQQEEDEVTREHAVVNPFLGDGHAGQPPHFQQSYPFHPAVPYHTGDENSFPGYPMPQGPPSSGLPYGYGFPAYQQPVWDPRFQQYVYVPAPPPPQFPPYPPPSPYYPSYQHPPPRSHMRRYESADSVLPSPADDIDVGAEPVLTLTPHHLDIDIRDDQVLLSTRACLSRPGFIHALVAFTVSGIVINTLSTFMDYLVRLNGAGREYTGIVGGSFQFVIMISSLIIGQFTDKTRAYYSVAVAMLVLGAFALAECGVNLDSDRGTELRWSLVIVAALVGPLQPVSTELGVDVVYPLSENTVLVIQQLFSNLLSALFIPCFKAFRDFGVRTVDEYDNEQPQFTFSFYVLIVLHAAATVFFATFNGRYLRYEHELEKKASQERKAAARVSVEEYSMPEEARGERPELDPLIPPIV